MKYKIEDIIELATDRNVECLSDTYMGYDKPLKFKCEIGHYFEKSPRYLFRGRWCNECKRSISEEISRYVLETIFDKKFDKVNIDCYGHILELDGYNDELKIAFEYNGKQHYEITYYTQTDEKLKHRLYLDGLKRKYCLENGIHLIEIPYTEKSDILGFIKGVLSDNDIPFVDRPVDIESFILKYSYYSNRYDKIKDVVESKGGVINEYKNSAINISCKNGHTWDSKFHMIKRGIWCKQCFIDDQKRSYQDILDVCDLVDVKCLSTEKDYDDGSGLTIECVNGHISDISVAKLDSVNYSDNFTGRRICKECFVPRQIKAFSKVEDSEFICLDKENYENRSTVLEWRCSNGHITKDKLKNLIERKRNDVNKCLCKLCN
jgi:hypothetical protein